MLLLSTRVASPAPSPTAMSNPSLPAPSVPARYLPLNLVLRQMVPAPTSQIIWPARRRI